MIKQPLIIISGPTASGKSALGVRLARDIGGEIVSADSMQVYKYMNIGTAKITPGEMDGIPHHMLDVCDPKIDYSIADYKEAAKKCVLDILSRHKVPIVVGGTGFYIHALLYDTDFGSTESDGSVRAKIENDYSLYGPEIMHLKLKEIDPEAAESIHMNDTKRVVRALEFYELYGYKISQHNREALSSESPYDFIYIALNRDRKELYPLIDERVDKMMAQGLPEEVKALKEYGCRADSVSMQGIGYKELFNSIDYEAAAEEIKLNSRHYAKRQFTWLRHEKDVTWIDSPVSEEDYRWILKECLKKRIRITE
ncbi:MAG: tRNA (adenosine(37)-N6)-dimethylallyltransferase MiaA [Lachnospiraceae bacterium]|nr:tRNA (adenosine(37)-N6)-dimethylallyltransferase MiaA [Lachnospiraceae bacterium]